MSGAPIIFDPLRRTRAIERALKQNADAFILEDMAEDVLERVDFMQLDPGRALAIGSGPTELGQQLEANGWDVESPDPLTFDEEMPWGTTFDLVVSLGRLDRVNDLPGALLHMRSALADEGVSIACFLGAGSLPQLRAALLAADGDRPAARLHPMVDSGSASGLMQRAGFARHVVDSHTLDVRYSSLDRLVDDLRGHGFANQLASTPPILTRDSWDRARKSFSAAASRDGKTNEKFEILTLTGWR